MKKRFAELPVPVQRAITSVDIQKKLREASDTHKLHLDQWEVLENEVLMTLFGITPIDELQASIQKEVGVSAEIAAKLSADISRIVFEPIREELERELEHPEAKEKEMSGIEAAREQILAGDQAQGIRQKTTGAQTEIVAPQPPPVAPATPPPTPPTEKAIRAPSSGAYKTGEASTARKDVHDDPYREPPA